MKLKQKSGKQNNSALLKGKIGAVGPDAPDTIVGKVIFSPKKGSSTEQWQEYLKAIRLAKNLIAVAQQVEVEALMLAPNNLLAIITVVGGVNSHGFKIARELLMEPARKHQAVITQVAGVMEKFKTGDGIAIILKKKQNMAYIAKLP
jgi:hypothetical protein